MKIQISKKVAWIRKKNTEKTPELRALSDAKTLHRKKAFTRSESRRDSDFAANSFRDKLKNAKMPKFQIRKGKVVKFFCCTNLPRFASLIRNSVKKRKTEQSAAKMCKARIGKNDFWFGNFRVAFIISFFESDNWDNCCTFFRWKAGASDCVTANLQNFTLFAEFWNFFRLFLFVNFCKFNCVFWAARQWAFGMPYHTLRKSTRKSPN